MRHLVEKIFGSRARGLLLLWLCLIGSGCVSPSTQSNWPDNIPPREFFAQAHQARTADDVSATEMEIHLRWIRRFYQGSVIYPLGWNRMTELLLDSLKHTDQRNQAKRRLERLGKLIVQEWARDNHKRKIDSSNISIWGNGLKTAAERNEQLAFIGRIETDVAALLNGTLKSSEITRQRYYRSVDYDNF